MSAGEYTLHREQIVNAPLEEVFAFFSQPENLQELTPSWVGFRFRTPSPIPMHPGALIDYTITTHGLPLRWRTQITEFDAPHLFVDVQLRGPYKLWIHTHRFERHDDPEAEGGATRIIDHVRYRLPLGPLGRIAHALFVRRDLAKIFDFRAHAIGERFGGSIQLPFSTTP